MKSHKRNNKMSDGSLDLLLACRDRGISVTELARQIGRARVTLYHAVERPTRYPVAFALITNKLAELSAQ